MDKSFREFIERTVRIHQLTEDEITQKYLNLLSCFPKTKNFHLLFKVIFNGNLKIKMEFIAMAFG